MKRVFRIISFLCIFMFISDINAYSFDEGKDISNNYINNNRKNIAYLINTSKIPFGYNDKTISYIDGFNTGGFINIYEINTSKINDYSYLVTSLPYFSIDGKVINDESSNNSNIRVTEYVKRKTKIIGSGTYKDPWKFVPYNLLEVSSNDESKGTVSPSYAFVYDGGDAIFTVTPKTGYKYYRSTCTNIMVNNDKITFKNIVKDEKCTINFIENIESKEITKLTGLKCDKTSYGSEPYQLEYTGECEATGIGTEEWKIRFLTTGKLKMNAEKMTIDIFTVGGGGGGGEDVAPTDGTTKKDASIGGGGGGYTDTHRNINVNAKEDAEKGKYQITIGAGGDKGKNGGKTTMYINSEEYSSEGGNAPALDKDGNKQDVCRTAVTLCWGTLGAILDGQCKGGNGGSGGGNGVYGNTTNSTPTQCTPSGSKALASGFGGENGSNGYLASWWNVEEEGKAPDYIGCPYGDKPEGYKYVSKGQGKTTCEFGEGTLKKCNDEDVKLYAGGGAGKPGVCGTTTGDKDHGGAGGGGNAYTDGKPNSGGGGGYMAKGGSGIVIIRNAKK